MPASAVQIAALRGRVLDEGGVTVGESGELHVGYGLCGGGDEVELASACQEIEFLE